MWSSDFLVSQPLALQLAVDCCCSFLGGDDTPRRQAITAQMTQHDWHDFLFWIQRHKLTSVIANDKAFLANNYLPHFVADSIADLQHSVAIKALAVFRATVNIQTLFDAHGIPCVFVKGVVLSQLLFDDCAMRETNDVDLFVPRDQVKAAEITLLDAGYRQISPTRPLTERQRKSFLRFGRHLVFCHPLNQVHIELHWQFAGNPYCVPVAYLTEMLKQCATVEVYGHSIKTFSGIDTFIFLSIHGWLHRWAEAKWLFDMALLTVQLSEKRFALLYARTINLGLEQIVVTTLLLLQAVFGKFLPDWLKKYTNSPTELLVRHSLFAICQRDVSYLEKPRQLLLGALLETQLQRSLRFKLFHFYRLNISSDDWHSFPLPDQLFPLYALLHPFLWFRQKLS